MLNQIKSAIELAKAKINALEIALPHASCQGCVQHDIDELRELKNALEISYDVLAKEQTNLEVLLSDMGYKLKSISIRPNGTRSKNYRKEILEGCYISLRVQYEKIKDYEIVPWGISNRDDLEMIEKGVTILEADLNLLKMFLQLDVIEEDC